MAEDNTIKTDEALIVPKKSPVALILIINVIVVGGIVAFFLLRGSQSTTSPAPGTQAAAAVPTPAPAPGNLAGPPGPLMTLDNFIVNLADQDVNRYLKVGLTLELGSEQLSETIKKREPMIRDAIITLTSSLSFQEIRTTSGKGALREQIIAKLNGLLGANQVRNVYFNEFVVQ